VRFAGLRYAGLWFLILVTGAGVALAVSEGTRYLRSVGGVLRVVRPSHAPDFPPVLASLRAMDGDSLPGKKADALLLVYHTKCLSCRYNMANWMALIAEVRLRRPEVTVAAVSVEPDSVQYAYWGVISPSYVRLLGAPDADALVRQIGTRSVPSTIVVREGRVVETAVGILGPARQRRVLSLLE